MYVRIIVLIIIYSLSQITLLGQSKDILAQSAVLNAESSYEDANYEESLEYLKEAEGTLGKTNSRIQYLRVKSFIALGTVNGISIEMLTRADQELKIFFNITNEISYSPEKYGEMVKELAHIKKLIKDAEIEKQRIFSAQLEYNRNDEAAFKTAKQQNTPQAYDLYIKNYPKGKHIEEADNGKKVAELREKSAPKLQELSEYIRKHPKNYYYYQERAKLKSEYEDYQGAIQDYTTALELKPNKTDEPFLYFNRGMDKFQVIDYPGAISDLSKYIQSYPDQNGAYIFRGVSYYYLGDYINAERDMIKYLEYNPNDYAYYIKGQINFIKGDYLSAVDDYSKAIGIEPKEDYYLNRGINKLILDDPIGAIQDINYFLNANPSECTAIYYRAESYLKINALNEAKDDFKTIIETGKDSTMLAFSNYYLGRKETAYKMLTDMIMRSPQNSAYYYNIACMYSLDNKKEDSLKSLRKAFENGYKNFRWLLADDDFENINKEQAFIDLINEFKQ